MANKLKSAEGVFSDREEMARMASSMARSNLRSASLVLRRGKQSKAENPAKRSFSATAHDDAHETAKWEKITYVGIVTCTILSIYNLSKGHPHRDEPPAYSYLRIRNKEFPWGPDGLFEMKHH